MIYVKRKEVLDALKKAYTRCNNEELRGLKAAIDIVEKLPVEGNHVGKWYIVDYWKRKGDGKLHPVPGLECDQCYYSYEWHDGDQVYNYCPDCGSEMENTPCYDLVIRDM